VTAATRIGNAAKAVGRVVDAVARGEPVAVLETHRIERLEICMNKCPWMVDEALAECSACGCYIPLKARLATEQCPKGRWDALDGRYSGQTSAE